MKKTFLGLVLAVVSATGYAQKDARIQEIRSAYSNAKQKMSKNGKDGQSPRDLWIERNDGQPTSTHGIARC